MCLFDDALTSGSAIVSKTHSPCSQSCDFLEKILRYYDTKAVRGNSRISKSDLQYVILNCLRQDNTLNIGGTYDVILNLFQNLKKIPRTLTLPPSLRSGNRVAQLVPRWLPLFLKGGREELVNEAHSKHLVPYCLSNLVSSKKAAFTLAEVLITLGIIGVVAAMTIPTLISNYEKKFTSTGVRNFHSLMAQAYQLSMVENGNMETWSFPLNKSDKEQAKQFFDKYFSPYLHVLNECSDEDSIQEKFTNARTSPVYTLKNGMQFVFIPNAADNDYEGKYVYLILDINGNKGPNRDGRDIFYLDIFPNNGIVWVGRVSVSDEINSVTRDDLINGVLINEGVDTACCTNQTCATPQYQYYACGALIQLDGWQIKEDYPW